MDPTDYQLAALRTASSLARAEISPRDAALLRGAVGLAGEAGEVADAIKKVVFHGHELDTGRLAAELGDVLWYVAVLAADLRLDLGEIMAANVAKLRARYPDGFTQADSIARRDEGGAA